MPRAQNRAQRPKTGMMNDRPVLVVAWQGPSPQQWAGMSSTCDMTEAFNLPPDAQHSGSKRPLVGITPQRHRGKNSEVDKRPRRSRPRKLSSRAGGPRCVPG